MKKNYFFHLNFIEYKFFGLLLFNKLTFLFIFLSIVLFSKFYSQETQVIGLENVYISEGATIISVPKDKSEVASIEKPKEVITNTNSETKEVNTIIEKDSYKVKKKKLLSKKIDKKTIKFIENRIAEFQYTSSNEKSKDYFQVYSLSLKFCINTVTLNHFLKNEDSLVINLKLSNFQNKINAFYKNHKDSRVEDSIFTRPPPYFLV